MTPWLLIPVKAFDAGKSRLRTVLADDARRDLNELFLRRTLAAAREFPGPRRTAVISECDRVLRVAAACGVRTVQASGPGLNRAASEGIAHVRRRGAQDVLLMACDLPTVNPSDLRELAERGRRDGILICPDKHRTGTNAILVPRGAHLKFRFGSASALRHCHEALRAGFSAIVHFNAAVAFDVDDPHDLALWLGACGVLSVSAGSPRV